VKGEDVFEFVHPQCARERAEDMEEVRAMLDAGEIDVAVDELRWLLQGCSPLVEAHKLLGEIALAAGDLQLARGHFGYGYELGLKALPKAGLPAPLPYARPSNQAFFEAGKGLAWCLDQSGDSDLAAEVVEQLRKLDPTDPLGVGKMLPQAGGRD
jgi:tetratricopeptide (TPR) repeat protein